MSVAPRQVKNKRDASGVLTGRAGTVYDVRIKYKAPEGERVYTKKGFPTKQAAQQHEAEIKVKLTNPAYLPAAAAQGKTTVAEYLETWVEQHGKANLRPSTFTSYRSFIRKHITPNIGHVPLRSLTPAMIDGMLQKLSDQGLAASSVRYAQRILSVALEAARKYHYIEGNPARDILTRFGKQGRTPDPYTIPQMQRLLSLVAGQEWEMPIMLAGMYGLRLGEILGLRWDNVDFGKEVFHVVEQLPFQPPAGTKLISDMAPVKSEERTLPITAAARPYFERQRAVQERQKELAALGGTQYYANRLVVARPDGSPYRKEGVSKNFGQLLYRLGMPHIRFHDLRHTAATNMHQLTGDFYTVGQILGHSLKGVGIQLGISNNLEAVTAQYIDVRLDRKSIVLKAYHDALLPPPAKDRESAEKERPPKKRREMER